MQFAKLGEKDAGQEMKVVFYCLQGLVLPNVLYIIDILRNS